MLAQPSPGSAHLTRSTRLTHDGVPTVVPILSALLAIGLSLATASASAQASLAFRVESRTEATCPAADQFARQLRARTPLVRPAFPDEPALDLQIEISASGPGLVGRLTLREPSRATTVREVPGASCSEIVNALALIAAVLIDPGASSELGDGSAEDPPPPAAQPPPRPIPAEPAPVRPLERRPAASRRDGAAAAAPASERWWMGVGFGAGVESAPTPVPAAALSADAVASVRSWLWVGAAVLHAQGVTLWTPAGSGSISWTAARLQGCPLRWPASGRLALRPCALFEAGQLGATGERTVDRQTVRVPWWSTGAGVVLTASLVERLSLVGHGGAVLPWRRERFYFAPDSAENTAFRVPVVGAHGRLGLIVRLN